jgi:PAS domain S-box-containing protein
MPPRPDHVDAASAASVSILFARPEGHETGLADRLASAADGVAVETGTLAGVADALDGGGFDCLVVASEDPDSAVSTVETVRERHEHLPVICCGSDPAAAEPVLSAGATDFQSVRDEAGDLELLAHRVTSAVENAAARRAAEESRDREEELLVRTRAMEKASIGLTLADPEDDNGLVWINEGFEEMTGYDEADVLGRNCRFLQGEDTDEAAVARLGEGIENEESVSALLRNYRKNGTEFWNRVDVDPIYDEDGELVRFLGSQTDVTDRVERQRTIAELHGAMRDLVEADTRGAVADLAVTAVEEVLDYEFAGVHFHDAETGTLEPVATGDSTERHYGSLYAHPDDEGTFGRAFAEGTPVVHRHLGDEVDHDYAPIGSLMVFPLGDHGTLGIGTATVGAIDEENRAVAEILAANTTVALDRVDRERALRDHQDRLRSVVAATRELMSVDGAEAAIDATVDVASDVLGFDAAVVRRHDGDASVLTPVAAAGTESVDDRPTVDVEDSPHGRAFRTGESAVGTPETGDDPFDRGVFSQSLYVPLGEFGLLSLGTTGGTFDASDRQLAELLGASLESALERARRRETMTRYAEVLETVEGRVFALDGDGNFSLVTDPLAAFLGYDREELEGEHFSTVLDEDAIGAAHNAIDRLSAFDREAATFQADVVAADGDRIPVEVEGSQLRTGSGGEIVGVVRDRSELEATRTELERERDRFANLFEHLPDPVNEVEFVDDTPRIRAVNPAFEEAFGYDADRLVDADANEVIRPPDEEGGPDRSIDDRAREGEVVTEEVRRRTAEGVRDFLFRGIPYGSDGGVRALGVYTDITDQKRLQRRLRVLNRVLRHNVRNEMTVVIGYAELLADELDGGRLTDAAGELLDSAREVSAISQQARAVEKVFRSDADGPTDVSTVARAAARTVGDAHPDVTVDVAAGDPQYAATDDGIRLAVENLIENAIEHNDGDGPHVRVETLTVDADTVGIRVADDGPGIPAHERSVVAGDQEVTQLEHGSGLGLWVVKWLVEAAGGTVRFAESDLGGTAVTVELPRSDE